MDKLRAAGLYIFSGHFTQGVVDAGFDVVADLEDGNFGTASHTENFPSVPVFSNPDTWPLARLKEEKLDLLYSNAPCAGLSLCFLAGTPVSTLSGQVPIEAVQRGQVVLSYHSGRFQPVTKTFRNLLKSQLVSVKSEGAVLFTCTAEHPICTNYAGEPIEWTPAINCGGKRAWSPTLGTYLNLTVEVVPTPPGRTWVYNLEVDADHCYVANGVLVHNCNSERAAGNKTNDGLHRANEVGLSVRPRAFVVESVTNLFRQGSGLVDGWEAAWKAAGYNTCRLLENAEHLGLPQTRRRALFVAAQANLDFGYESGNDYVAKPLTVWDAISDLVTQPIADDPRSTEPYATEPQNEYQAWCRRDSKAATWHIFNAPTKAIQTLIPHIKPGGRVDEVPEEIYEQTYYKVRRPNHRRPDSKGKPCFLFRRLHWDKPSVTLTGGPYLFHPEFDRLLTPREQARLMGVPDTFMFAGKSRNSPYFEIGKAVSPLVGGWVARQIATCLRNPHGRQHQSAVNLMQHKKTACEAVAA